MDPKLKIEPYLRFGSYPKVITTTDTDLKRKYLDELVNNYLYHDLLEFRSIRKPKKIVDLLSLLALQIGSEVSINELSSNLDIERSSVEKYLDILEKMFVIVNLRGFSRNLRKEIYKTSKYYFVDLGVRNVLIQNFNSMNLRSDAGALFENFCIIERIKFINNNQKYANYYFWRTYNQKEIDLIEESESKLNAFEFKWSPRNEKISSAYNEFEKVYKNTTYNLITPTSFKSFSIKVEI